MKMAVFTLETDYSSETGYSSDNSRLRQIIRLNFKMKRS